MDHWKQNSISPGMIDRWQSAAGKLGEHGLGMRLEFGRIGAGEDSRRMLARRANAVRIAEDAADSELSSLGADNAAEIEGAAQL